MNYKKFALAAVCAGMLVSCGKTPAPAPDWSAQIKALFAEKLHGVNIPYFLTDAFGSLTFDVGSSYVLIDGGKLESPESIKAAAELLKGSNFVDLYESYRSNPTYASQVEWLYPMQTRLEVADLGPRYVNVSLSGQLPAENSPAEEGEDPAGPQRYFHCEIWDPYQYTWTDSATADLIAYSFGSKDEEGYYADETIANELESVAYIGQATYLYDGNIYMLQTGEYYAPDIDDGLEEVAQSGYMRVFFEDIIFEELGSFAEDLELDHWTVNSFEPGELEPGYLGRYYQLVSPSEYFSIDVYYAEGEAMFKVQLLPEYSDAVRKVAQLSQTNLYEYSLDEKSNTYYSYFDVEEYYGSEVSEKLDTITTAESAKAAFDLIKNSNAADVEVVDEFVTYSNYQGEGILNVDNHQVYISADFDRSIDFEVFDYVYFFYWSIQVSDWPEYPEVINAAFAEACGATNFHQFYEQADGSFAFGKECESADDAAAVVTALSAFDGAEVLHAFDGTYARVKLGDYMVTVEYEETEASKGYSVKVTDYVAPDPVVLAVSTALELDPYSFQVDEESGAFFILGTEEALWAAAKAVVEDLFAKVSALDGAEAATPEVRDEDAQYWGSYVGTVLYQGKLIQVSTYRTDMDEDYNGIYVYQIVVCEPKQDDPEVTAVMEAIAAAAGLEVEFSVIDGKYYFSEEYVDEIPGGHETMVAWGEAFITALKGAYPEIDVDDVYVDEYGDVHITVHVNEEIEVEVFIVDWTGYGRGFNFNIGAEAYTPTQAE